MWKMNNVCKNVKIDLIKVAIFGNTRINVGGIVYQLLLIFMFEL